MEIEVLERRERTCPKCGFFGLVGKYFGYRMYKDDIYAQSYCRECRNKKPSKEVVPPTVASSCDAPGQLKIQDAITDAIEEKESMGILRSEPGEYKEPEKLTAKKQKPCTKCGGDGERRQLSHNRLHPWCGACEKAYHENYRARKNAKT